MITHTFTRIALSPCVKFQGHFIISMLDVNTQEELQDIHSGPGFCNTNLYIEFSICKFEQMTKFFICSTYRVQP